MGGAQGPVTVGEVSEEQLLASFTPFLPSSPYQLVGNGDDCAVLGTSDGRYVVSTDVLVEGHHFRTDWSTARQIGARAAAQNLADVAAMGARPTAMVVGLVLPASTPRAWLQDFAEGLGAAAAQAGAGVVGGDLSAGEKIVVSVTVHGDLESREPVTRGGAQSGDLLVHVGDLGCSAAGLALLRSGWRIPPDLEEALDSPDSSTQQPELAGLLTSCVDRFCVPCPPLEAGPALARAGASAMMDVSDSLLRDCGRIARASGVRIDVDQVNPEGGNRLAEAAANLLPVARYLGVADPQAQAAAWVLTGGEDHGMLATVPPCCVEHLPEGAHIIGRVEEAGAAQGAATGPGSVTVGGQPWGGSVGWDHFGD